MLYVPVLFYLPAFIVMGYYIFQPQGVMKWEDLGNNITCLKHIFVGHSR
jgi:hypothetical protein